MELLTFSIDIFVLLFAVALFAGVIDTLAGGGGLITVPALLLAGISPLEALATNKVQGGAGTAIASMMMLRTGQVHWQEIRPLMLASFIGAMTGTVGVHFVDTKVLELAIPLILFTTGLYFLGAPLLNRIKAIRNARPQTSKRYQCITVPIVGFYDGMFGPGAGSFFTLAGVALKKLPLVQATAQAKNLNFASNIASVFIYILSGKVLWTIGLVMMAGQTLGAWLGSHLLMNIKPELLRWIVVIVCFSVLTRYVIQAIEA